MQMESQCETVMAVWIEFKCWVFEFLHVDFKWASISISRDGDLWWP